MLFHLSVMYMAWCLTLYQYSIYCWALSIYNYSNFIPVPFYHSHTIVSYKHIIVTDPPFLCSNNYF